ncbi:hypothetical protein DFJ73DRAFT_482661 [Zopfochytrium polystomum]|nr:hypothetical protein DFJ73DRAFT_482661 [Zopfochytrium polystomum]
MEATAPPDAAAGTSTSTTTTVAVRFKYRGKFKKIRVAPAAGYDAVLRQVALGWKIAGGAQQHQQPTIELEFTDPATDEVNVLSADDDLQEVFAEAYKWEVTLDETSNAKGDAYGAGAGDDNDSRPFHADTGAQPLNEDAALHDQEVPTNGKRSKGRGAGKACFSSGFTHDRCKLGHRALEGFGPCGLEMPSRRGAASIFHQLPSSLRKPRRRAALLANERRDRFRARLQERRPLPARVQVRRTAPVSRRAVSIRRRAVGAELHVRTVSLWNLHFAVLGQGNGKDEICGHGPRQCAARSE